MSDTNDLGSKNPIQNIILDTCILQYLSNKYLKGELGKYLLSLVGRGFGLAISDISISELLQDATLEQEKISSSTLSLFNRYPLNEDILIAGAQISTLYKIDNTKNNSISLPDKIIASASVLSGSLILTADVNDYPRLFFSEAEEKWILYRKNNKNNILVIQLLRPNTEYIKQKFSERI
ncbi:MAG: hypothetical protein UR39_C0001G0077 [Candidatus Woesebacteria bacterium GW2011_GWA1_33_30]|uniref:PIN domain-containing protein n=1 Tax=Candidatus Woesebacteria bacterium GW2011_GWA2_33_28 TaxID=1618561 RepID=A0A0G0CY22_9BACT|nr:MAG: hypothetical protein UR38_C0001G0078 [Candidatus Woesebacteria bacterium GW2011_GWA2_33_28]KKP49044.1 MAG: hypothetical protein UR39_C0001G0077 [Candidatus Woesebacteria bacterium GW2011_GWA1_33_30]KKP49848.1 MAG: hypothetical protein UR40_C0003G0020 [Microgenomates group bacterium GW2011_GWC1_33_32]KKP52636.1 MAG: hypothetical protein UR44_C0001G0078 [Candidatus Woesebacteria bacterium GW2011_GWB1_33_38]KKP58813.1 MAG: hypothetical protein UR48_C0001G0017 [Microgenomates group bacteriu